MSSISNMSKAYTVAKTAVTSESVLDYFEQVFQVSSTDCISVPETFHFSNDPERKRGDRAEKIVVDAMKKTTSDISGLKLLFFHSLRVKGQISANNKDILREVDIIAFLEYQGRMYCLIMETKCNDVIRISKTTRKKAVSQLKTLKQMLSSELNICTDKIQTHAVWPFMEPNERCPKGKGSHPTFQPVTCDCNPDYRGIQGSSNQEPPGFHLFKDTVNQDSFSNWLQKEILDDPLKAMDLATYEKLMAFTTNLSMGALLDKEMGCFCILAEDQKRLVYSNDDILRNPKAVIGLAGTGKTICICARIEYLNKKNIFGPNCRSLVICFHLNVKKMITNKLKACGVDLTYIEICLYEDMKDEVTRLFEDNNKNTINEWIVHKKYRYTYIDSAEDLSLVTLEKALQAIVEKKWFKEENGDIQAPTLEIGDFWILFDSYQSLKDIHTMEKGINNRLYWVGRQLNPKLLDKGVSEGSVFKLNTTFRVPAKVMDHIEKLHVIPTKEFPKPMEIQGLGVKRKTVTVNSSNQVESLSRDILAGILYDILLLQGIHPGQCAVLYTQDMEDTLFPSDEGGRREFLKLLNEEIKSRMMNPSHAPQVCENMEESVFYSQTQYSSTETAELQDNRPLLSEGNTNPIETVQYHFDSHPESLTMCKCKVFFGSIQEMKGCEAQIVVYLNPVEETLEAKGKIEESLLRDQNRYTASFNTLVRGIYKLARKWWWLILLAILGLIVLAGVTWISRPEPSSPTTAKPTTTSTTSSTTTITTESTETTSSATPLTSTTKSPIQPTTSPNQDHSVEIGEISCGALVFLLILIGVLLYWKYVGNVKDEVLRTLPYYLALSRCTAEVHVLDIPLPDIGSASRPRGQPVPVPTGWRVSHQERRRTKKIRVLIGGVFVIVLAACLAGGVILYLTWNKNLPGSILVTGGSNKSSQITGTSETIGEHTHSTGLPLPQEMYGHVGISIGGNTHLMCGGNTTQECYILNLSHRRWEKHSTLLLKRYGASSVVFESGVWLIGGRLGGLKGSITSGEFLEVGKNTWTPGPDIPGYGVYQSCMAWLNSTHIILIGGTFDATQVRLYDSITKVWTELPHLVSYGVREHDCISTDDGVLLTGGVVDDGYATDQSILFDMTGKPHNVGYMTVGRAGHKMVSVWGKVLVLGGWDGRNYHTSIEEWVPSNRSWVRSEYSLSMGRTGFGVMVIPDLT